MNNNPFDNYKGTSDSAVRGGLREMPMLWYKFLIYFFLWVSAAANILSAYSYVSGGAQTEEMLAAFPMLKTIDLVYGVLTLGMGVLALLARFALANYRKNAPALTVGLFSYGFVISLGYNAAVLSMTASSYEPADLILTGLSVGTSVIMNVVMIACNYVYFKKRRRLFNK